MKKDEYQIKKDAKKTYKDLKKNPVRFQETRSDIVQTIIKSPTPNWGGISVKLSN